MAENFGEVSPVGSSVLEVRGTPSITQGYLLDSSWTADTYSQDARILGEIANQGTITAANVRITVTLRDSNENLLGRVRDHAVGTIQPGDSELFEIFVMDVFSEFGVDTSAYQIEVDISDD